MARVVALCADLLFGSKLVAQQAAAGEQLELTGDAHELRERLAAPGGVPQVLVVDLTDEDLGGSALVESLSSEGSSAGVRTLGFYSHVDTAARERAERAGFDVLVPRSRMARDGAELVARLLEGSPQRRGSG
jgi:DNA-binding NarL/FixJ family response regulator